MIVLDEVDQLDSKGQEVLYTLFEWPSLPNSKLLLVGKSLALIALSPVFSQLCSVTLKAWRSLTTRLSNDVIDSKLVMLFSVFCV